MHFATKRFSLDRVKKFCRDERTPTATRSLPPMVIQGCLRACSAVKRRCGSRTRRRETRSLNWSEHAPKTPKSTRAAKIAWMSPISSGASNGGKPRTIRNSITPTDHRSAALSTCPSSDTCRTSAAAGTCRLRLLFPRSSSSSFSARSGVGSCDSGDLVELRRSMRAMRERERISGAMKCVVPATGTPPPRAPPAAFAPLRSSSFTRRATPKSISFRDDWTADENARRDWDDSRGFPGSWSTDDRGDPSTPP
mmetsp:Transcript_1573/g.3040  ORF Transcript_1573/g.3040 Transcript_1573/m.3040 type:complete len:252 (-) Transcript_1573:382-1137(-)